MERRITKKLRELLKKKLIDNNIYNDLKPKGSRLPYLYGLPKMHKPDIPMRPILSMINSPYHKVARWLAEMLEPIRGKLAVYSLKDTFQFAKQLENSSISNKFMVSFDVSSLFTKIPLEETVEIICQHAELTPLPKDVLKQLLLMCTKDVQFQFNNTLYRQIDGVAMGSPLGPILADIFMGNLEQTRLKSAISQTNFYTRYVDDTFVILNSFNDAAQVLKVLNSTHPNINFTMECEKDDKFHFLDLGIQRDIDGKIIRYIHRKETWRAVYLNFKSFCPMSYKKGLVRTLFDRVRKLCSREKIEEELSIVEKCLRDNGYPQKFIDKYGRRHVEKVKSSTVEKKPIFLQLAFKGDDTASRIRCRLNAALKRTYPAAKLVCVYQTTSCLKQSKVDKYPPHVTSNCVYQFTCTCQSTYIGRTERRVIARISEHIPKNLRLKGPQALNSAIARHLLDTGHIVDNLQSFKIINKQKKPSLLRFAEAITIKRLQPNLCTQKETVVNLALPW